MDLQQSHMLTGLVKHAQLACCVQTVHWVVLATGSASMWYEHAELFCAVLCRGVLCCAVLCCGVAGY
jgi:hypothetical protein